jgi:toxin CcdB
MAQYDLYRPPRPTPRGEVLFLLDLQSDLLEHFATRIVVPLMVDGSIDRVGRLHPVFEVDGDRVVMATDRLAAIQRRELGAPVGSLAAKHSDIIAAIDVLWSGI